MHTVEGACTHDLAEKIHCRVVHYGHMVGIPAHRAAHMEHQLGHEQKHGGNLVGHTLGRMEMACVKSYHHIVFRRICRVEIV